MKIKSALYFTTIVAILFSPFTMLTAAQSGKILKETRKLPSFSSIQSNGSVDIIVTQGNAQTVVVEADAGLLPHLRTEVEDGVLSVGIKSYRKSFKVAKVYVQLPKLDKASLNGSGDLIVKNNFKGNSLKVKLNGSGDFDGDLELKKLEIYISGSGDASFRGINGDLKISVGGSGDVYASNLRLSDCSIKIAGSGDMTLKGSTENMVIGLAGSGDVDAHDLKAVNVSVSIAGSGDVDIFAVESISASIIGSGDVSYSGNPKTVNVSSTGSGSLIKN
ncbi:MAG: DUF2807 domain-containing protein [Chlorobi bacterium]|nr:DUF2807 domain-containing protein [Chlorobiota bacterium]